MIAHVKGKAPTAAEACALPDMCKHAARMQQLAECTDVKQPRPISEEDTAYLQLRGLEGAQGHCAVHELCEAEGRHGWGSCHTSPDQSLHLICPFNVESQVSLS